MSEVKRVKRIPVINYSRAGIPYVKYIDPTNKPLPPEMRQQVQPVENRRMRRAAMFESDVPKGMTFGLGGYQPKPRVIYKTSDDGKRTRCIVIPPAKAVSYHG